MPIYLAELNCSEGHVGTNKQSSGKYRVLREEEKDLIIC